MFLEKSGGEEDRKKSERRAEQRGRGKKNKLLTLSRRVSLLVVSLVALGRSLWSVLSLSARLGALPA
jgi:hypothetical protein